MAAASAAAFSVQGSVEQVDVTELAANAQVSLPNSSGATVCARMPTRSEGCCSGTLRREPATAWAAQATSGHRWRTLTIHQAWTVTVTGARSVAKRAESLPHTYGPSRPSGASLSPRSRIGLELLLAEDGSMSARQ